MNSTKTAPVRSRKRRDPYQQVTDTILQRLEEGVVPWRCPWNRKVGKPTNFHTLQPYRGVNVLLLGCRGHASPFWLTFRQASDLGGHVRKGERGTPIVKYGQYERQHEGSRNSSEKETVFFLKEYVAFNAVQIEGIDFSDRAVHSPPNESDRIQAAEKIIGSMPQPPQINEGGSVRASYNRKTDAVKMPAFARFDGAESFYLTLFHELIHATGHHSRLNRKSLVESDGFGGKVYSEEELVAEMGAAFLGMEADLVQDDHEQSAAYIESWLEALSEPDHKRWIVKAASQATKAADFILGNLGSFQFR